MKKYILALFIVLALLTAFSSYADEVNYNPTLLPTSKLYFVKEWWRGLKEFMIRNPVAKAEFQFKVMEEKAIEAKEVFESDFDDTDVLKKVADNYTQAKQRLKVRLETLKNNPNIEELLGKVDEQIQKHDELLLKDLTIKMLRIKAKEADEKETEGIEAGGVIEINESEDFDFEDKDDNQKEEVEDENKTETIIDCKDAPLPELAAPPAGCRWDLNCLTNTWQAKMTCDQKLGEILE